MNRSVNISSAIFIVLIISTFYSCKKEDENYTSSHVFWFDKDTKDSLVKHGYFCLTANYDYSPSNGDAGFGLTVDTGTFRWSLPGCDEKNLLYLKMKLKKGEKKTIPYRILRAEKNLSGFTSAGDVPRNWNGEFTVSGGACSQTQLVW